MAEQNQQNQGGSKVEKKFNASKEKLEALLAIPPGGGLPNSEPKVPRARMRGLIDQMFEKRREKLEETLKEEASGAVDSWLKYVSEKKKLEQEMKKATEAEMEKFCSAVDKIFTKIENFDEEIREYRRQFGGNQPEQAPAEPADDESLHGQ